MSLSIEVLRAIAAALKSGGPLPPLRRGERFFMERVGKVVGKERARGVNFYTPKETRQYEADLKKLATSLMKGRLPMKSPVVVHLKVIDHISTMDEEWVRRLKEEHFLFDTSGADLDNREKAILDAMNGVAYVDDRQIVQVFKTRYYSKELTGFKVELEGVGLTKYDLAALSRLMER